MTFAGALYLDGRETSCRGEATSRPFRARWEQQSENSREFRTKSHGVAERRRIAGVGEILALCDLPTVTDDCYGAAALRTNILHSA